MDTFIKTYTEKIKNEKEEYPGGGDISLLYKRT